jgi:hypothetical protein
MNVPLWTRFRATCAILSLVPENIREMVQIGLAEVKSGGSSGLHHFPRDEKDFTTRLEYQA